MKEDLTFLLERLPEHEAHCGVRFEGLYVELETIEDDLPTLIIRGEAHSMVGSAVRTAVEIRANAYNQSGQVIGSGMSFIDPDTFFDFETIEIFMMDLDVRPSKVRLFPKVA